jgi:hypothetical protein
VPTIAYCIRYRRVADLRNADFVFVRESHSAELVPIEALSARPRSARKEKASGRRSCWASCCCCFCCLSPTVSRLTARCFAALSYGLWWVTCRGCCGRIDQRRATAERRRLGQQQQQSKSRSNSMEEEDVMSSSSSSSSSSSNKTAVSYQHVDGDQYRTVHDGDGDHVHYDDDADDDDDEDNDEDEDDFAEPLPLATQCLPLHRRMFVYRHTRFVWSSAHEQFVPLKYVQQMSAQQIMNLIQRGGLTSEERNERVALFGDNLVEVK